MATQRALAALVVIVGVVAIGAAAAGVDDASQRSGTSDDLGVGPGDGPGRSGDGDQRGAEPGGGLDVPAWPIELYFVLTLGVFSLVGLLGAAYLVWKHGFDGLLAILNTTAATLLGIGLFLAFLAALLWIGFDWSTLSGPPNTPEVDPGGGAPDERQPENVTGVPPLLVVGVVAALAALGVILVRRLGADGDGEPAEVHEEVELEEPVRERSRVPTPAVELVDEHPDNPVYRAWYDLVSNVGLAHERTRTPGEVAEAALDQGLPRDAVGTLTDTFSEVRYGHRPVTDDRARRARSAIETIERVGGET